MKHAMKRLALVPMAMSALFAGGNAVAEMSANVGVTSNYLWRGETQSADTAAISGGLDYAHDSGFYLGTWTSSLSSSAGYELDLYGGYAGEASGIGYDLGVIRYEYPMDGNDADFNEVYLGMSYGVFSAKLSYSNDYLNLDDPALYIEAGADIPLQDDLVLGLHVGRKSGDGFEAYTGGAISSLTDYSVSLSKGDFALAVTNTSDNAAVYMSDNYRVAVSWSHALDL